MARVNLTTAWTELGTASTGIAVQNLSSTPLLLAVAPVQPAVDAEVGFVLQPGDYLPVSNAPSSGFYARMFSGTGAAEFVLEAV